MCQINPDVCYRPMSGGVCTIERSKQKTTITARHAATTISAVQPLFKLLAIEWPRFQRDLQSGLARAELNGKGRRVGPAIALPVLDVKSLCTSVRAEAPLGGHRCRPADSQRLHAGLPEAPALAAIRRLVQ